MALRGVAHRLCGGRRRVPPTAPRPMTTSPTPSRPSRPPSALSLSPSATGGFCQAATFLDDAVATAVQRCVIASRRGAWPTLAARPAGDCGGVSRSIEKRPALRVRILPSTHEFASSTAAATAHRRPLRALTIGGVPDADVAFTAARRRGGCASVPSRSTPTCPAATADVDTATDKVVSPLYPAALTAAPATSSRRTSPAEKFFTASPTGQGTSEPSS